MREPGARVAPFQTIQQILLCLLRSSFSAHLELPGTEYAVSQASLKCKQPPALQFPMFERQGLLESLREQRLIRQAAPGSFSLKRLLRKSKPLPERCLFWLLIAWEKKGQRRMRMNGAASGNGKIIIDQVARETVAAQKTRCAQVRKQSSVPCSLHSDLRSLHCPPVTIGAAKRVAQQRINRHENMDSAFAGSLN